MMNKPGVNEMIDKVGCRYMLVMAVARRARQLLNDPEKLEEKNPVTKAVEELYNDEIVVDYPAEYGANSDD